MFSKTVLTSLILAGSVASSCSPKFNWAPCPFEAALREALNVTFPFDCSNFTAPLDYLDESSNKTIDLQLSRVPAVNGEAQGTIFLNFGGPGLEARLSLIASAAQILTITEGKFNLVAIDPRYVSTACLHKPPLGPGVRALAYSLPLTVAPATRRLSAATMPQSEPLSCPSIA